jgi:catechol 2,3-dioxygenase-like lactoylglutathione lyase family enzyme
MLDIIRKPKQQNHINPRIRAYGKARIDIAQRAATRDDWDRLWKKSTYPFPFTWGKSWKQCIEYKVADFPAEVGFFIDVLGFPVNAFDPDYAMFTNPGGDFYFSVVPVENKAEVTSPDSIRLQFMVERIMDTAVELERRGVKFDQWPGVSSSSSSLIIGSFRTPNGISIELWGFEQLEGDLEDQIAIAYFEEDDVEDNELVVPDDEEEEDEPEIDQLQIISPPSDPISNIEHIEEEPNEGGSDRIRLYLAR